MNDVKTMVHHFCVSYTKEKSYIVAINYIGEPLFKRELNSNKMKIFYEEIQYLLNKYGNLSIYSMPVIIYGIPDENNFCK